MIRGKQEGNLAFTVSYSMARDAKNKEAAWQLIRYLVGQPGHEDVDLEGARASVA